MAGGQYGRQPIYERRERQGVVYESRRGEEFDDLLKVGARRVALGGCVGPNGCETFVQPDHGGRDKAAATAQQPHMLGTGVR